MRRALLCVALSVLGSCTYTDAVTVSGFNLESGLPGFSCNDSNGVALSKRTSATDGGFIVVLDALDFGQDQPPCLSVTLDSYCQGKREGCPVLARGCWAMSLQQLAGSPSPVQAAFQYLHAIDAGISRVPEDRNVVLRVTAFALGSCDAGVPVVEKRAALLGCARSCPARLNGSSTVDVYLDTPPGSQACLPEVEQCAGLDLLHAQ